MKAKTKAAKLKSKRGRPRLPAVDRDPSGRKSQRAASVSKRKYEGEAEIMNVAVNRRIRSAAIANLALSMEQARDPRMGYVLGQMLVMGLVTPLQHEAGMRFADDMARFYGLTGIRFPSARAQDLFSIRGDDGETTQDRANAATAIRAKVSRLRAVLLDTGDIDTGRRAYRSVTQVCVLDLPDDEHFLRRGLNALGKHYALS